MYGIESEAPTLIPISEAVFTPCVVGWGITSIQLSQLRLLLRAIAESKLNLTPIGMSKSFKGFIVPPIFVWSPITRSDPPDLTKSQIIFFSTSVNSLRGLIITNVFTEASVVSVILSSRIVTL